MNRRQDGPLEKSLDVLMNRKSCCSSRKPDDDSSAVQPLAQLLSKTTIAIIFMLASLSLSMLGRQSSENRSVLDGRGTTPAQEQHMDTGDAPALTPAQIEEQIRQIQERQQDAPADDATLESMPFE